MKAGKLTDRLRLYRPVRNGGGDFGVELPTYEFAGDVWAELKGQSGRRTTENGEIFAEYDAEFNIRMGHGVTDGWQVQHAGGYRYNVEAVYSLRTLGMQTLKCNRVNL